MKGPRRERDSFKALAKQLEEGLLKGMEAQVACTFRSYPGALGRLKGVHYLAGQAPD